MKTKAWILLNNLKVSYISEWKDLWIIDELKTSQSIANTLISNETNINSAIERAWTLNRFWQENIEHALRNVAEYFRIKNPSFMVFFIELLNKYLIRDIKKRANFLDFTNSLPASPIGCVKFYWELIYRWFVFIRQTIWILLQSFLEFIFWLIYKNFWFFLWIAWWFLIFLLFKFEYNKLIELIEFLPKKEGKIDLQILTTIPSNILIIISSVNILIVSLLGYFIVFCFWNFKRARNIEEIYKYKALSIDSIGTLYYKWADEKEKALLFPKAIEAIFNQPDFDKWTTESGISIPSIELIRQVIPKWQ